MSLEAYYNNPEVILTTKITPKQKINTRLIKCGTWVLESLYLVNMGMVGFFLSSLVTLTAVVFILRYVKARPELVMDSNHGTLRIALQSLSGKSTLLQPGQVASIVVVSRMRASRRSPVKVYYPRFIVRNRNNPHKKIFLDGFELENIVEAHYIAQLVANFTHSRAFDIRGTAMPPVKSHIPTKFLSRQAAAQRNYYQPTQGKLEGKASSQAN